MSTDKVKDDPNAISAEQMKKAEEYIEQEEGAVSHYRGWLQTAITFTLVGMSLFHLYAAVGIVPTMILRPIHVGLMLVLVYLMFPVAARFRNRVMWFDVVFALIGAAAIVYLLTGGDDFWDRNSDPNSVDTWLGVAFIVLVL